MPYQYFGLKHNEVRCHEIGINVSKFTHKCLTWEMALKIVSCFSQGTKCRKGEIKVLDGQTASVLEGKFNVCYWVWVDEEARQWVIQFPKWGLLSDNLTLTKFWSEVAMLKFLKRNTTISVSDLITYDEHPHSFTITNHVIRTRLDVA